MEYRVLMLKYDAGDTYPITPAADELTSDNIIIVLDEFSKAVWLWLGSKARDIFKRGAMRKARGLLNYGMDYNQLKVGIGCSKLRVIDENELSDANVKADFDELKGVLRKVKVIDGKLAAIETGAPSEVLPAPKPVEVKPKPVEVKPVEARPIAPVEAPAQVETKPTPVAKPAVEEKKPVEEEKTAPEVAAIPEKIAELTPEVKASFLIYATIQEFPEVYIARHENKYVIEGEEGTLVVFKKVADGLELDPNYDFQGKQDKILDIYKELIDSVKG